MNKPGLLVVDPREIAPPGIAPVIARLVEKLAAPLIDGGSEASVAETMFVICDPFGPIPTPDTFTFILWELLTSQFSCWFIAMSL
jgi:hypothetical protein